MFVVHVNGDGIPTPRDRIYPDGTRDAWWAYRNGSSQHDIVLAAIEQLRQRIVNNAGVLDACNERFLAVSSQRQGGPLGFSDLFQNPEPRVIICRNAETAYWGCTHQTYIAITNFCFNHQGNPPAIELTAATILHELAHVVGATGNTAGRGHFIAESVLPPCGYSSCFHPGGGG